MKKMRSLDIKHNPLHKVSHRELVLIMGNIVTDDMYNYIMILN